MPSTLEIAEIIIAFVFNIPLLILFSLQLLFRPKPLPQPLLRNFAWLGLASSILAVVRGIDPEGETVYSGKIAVILTCNLGLLCSINFCHTIRIYMQSVLLSSAEPSPSPSPSSDNPGRMTAGSRPPPYCCKMALHRQFMLLTILQVLISEMLLIIIVEVPARWVLGMQYYLYAGVSFFCGYHMHVFSRLLHSSLHNGTSSDQQRDQAIIALTARLFSIGAFCAFLLFVVLVFWGFAIVLQGAANWGLIPVDSAFYSIDLFPFGNILSLLLLLYLSWVPLPRTSLCPQWCSPSVVRFATSALLIDSDSIPLQSPKHVRMENVCLSPFL